MAIDEEFATDEYRQESDVVSERLIIAMEAIIKMNESQARSILSIADTISEIRFVLDRQGSATQELKNTLENVKTDQISEPILADIHKKLKNLTDSWSVLLSTNSALEERLSKLEAKTDNTNEDLGAIAERLEGNIRRVDDTLKNNMELAKEGAEKNREIILGLKEDLENVKTTSESNAELITELKEYTKNVAEENKEIIAGLKENVEDNSIVLGGVVDKLDHNYASMAERLEKVAKKDEIEAVKNEMATLKENLDDVSVLISGFSAKMDSLASRGAEVNANIASLKQKIDNVATGTDAKIAKHEESVKGRIDYALNSLNEKLDSANSFTNRKLDDTQTWQKEADVQFTELKVIRSKLETIEQMIAELRPKRRTRKSTRRRAPAKRPEGAIVDYKAIEEMIVNHLKENGRQSIEALRKHTGIGETTMRKILHSMVKDGRLIRERQGKFIYYSARQI